MQLRNIPKEFLCDLTTTQEPMKDPVNYNGGTYERAHIEQQLNPAEILKLVPNHRLKAKIDAWYIAEMSLRYTLDARWRDYNRLRLEKLSGEVITTYNKPAPEQERFAKFGLNSVDSYCLAMLVGDDLVGKTTLAQRFLVDNDAAENHSRASYHANRKMRLSDKNIQINLWDPADENSFDKNMTDKMPGCHFFILVFDLTNRNSFTNVQSHLDNVRAHAGENVSLVLVGNKCDVDKREVTIEEVTRFAEANGMGYVEASAKADINVDLIFETARLFFYETLAAIKKDAPKVAQFKSAYNALWDQEWLGSPFNKRWDKVKKDAPLTLDEIERHTPNSPRTARAWQEVKPKFSR